MTPNFPINLPIEMDYVTPRLDQTHFIDSYFQ